MTLPAPITLSQSDYRLLRAHPRCTPAHLAVIDIMIETGEIKIEGAAPVPPAR